MAVQRCDCGLITAFVTTLTALKTGAAQEDIWDTTTINMLIGNSDSSKSDLLVLKL